MENYNEALILQEVYQGAAMGNEAIAHLMPLVKNVRFRSDLKTQEGQYTSTMEQAEQQLQALSVCPKELTAMQKKMICMCLMTKTLCNRETSHLAQLMIEGSNMGILSLTKVLNSCGSYQPDPAQEPKTDQLSAAETLAKNTIRVEEDNIDRLKVYLS